MGFFIKTKKNPGWMAISLQADGVCVAHVTYSPASKPVVELVAFYPADILPAAQAIEKLTKELHAQRYQCTTVLDSGEYQLLSVDAPAVPPDELKTAIRWRLKDMLDYHIDDATIDVLDVPVDKAASGRNKSMYAVAAKNQLIQQRQAMFLDAKIPLSVIDIPEMAQRNVSALLEQEGRGIAFLSFDAKGGLLTVTYAGELYLSRRIEVPLAQLQLADIEQRNACYDRITLELQRSLDHFDRQYHFINVAKMVLSPMGDAGQALQSYLSTNLYIPVENLELSAVLDISNAAELQQPEAQQRYFMTIGAAMRHEEKIL
jgi:MSHA biogenesis protein MshI